MAGFLAIPVHVIGSVENDSIDLASKLYASDGDFIVLDVRSVAAS